MEGKTLFQKRDRILGLLVVLLGAGILVESNRWIELFHTDPAGPSGAPKLLAGGIIFLGIVLFVGSFFARSEGSKEIYMDRTILTVFLLCGAYAFLLNVVGYLILTPLLIGSIMWTLLTRNRKEIILVSVFTTLVLFSVFHFGLKVDLPWGVLSFLFA